VLSLDIRKIENATIPVSTSWLLGACMEAKGKQDLWSKQKPETLRVLREQAIIQSAESSNRIEGVTVEAARLRPIVLGKSRPRDRSEEEIVGYRKALKWVFNRKRPIPIEAKTLLHLHALCRGGSSGDAGRWKKRDNEIIEVLPGGERRVRFIPTSAKKTPGTIDLLCDRYQEVGGEERFPSLLVIATFVFDFLCVHPFRDGNGRVSRLLTSLLLVRHGFEVCRYISLEQMVEETKEDYYGILGRCSDGWHEGTNEMLPWWNYFLSALRQAYCEFAERVEQAGHHGKGHLVRQVIRAQIGSFSLGELQAQCPCVSAQLIKKVLSEMKQAGSLRLVGRGRGARWENAG